MQSALRVLPATARICDAEVCALFGCNGGRSAAVLCCAFCVRIPCLGGAVAQKGGGLQPAATRAQGRTAERVVAAPGSGRHGGAAVPGHGRALRELRPHDQGIKGAFIDGPVQWFDVAGGARRARSAPPRGGWPCGESAARVPVLPVLERSQRARAARATRPRPAALTPAQMANVRIEELGGSESLPAGLKGVLRATRYAARWNAPQRRASASEPPSYLGPRLSCYLECSINAVSLDSPLGAWQGHVTYRHQHDQEAQGVVPVCGVL